MLRVALVGSRWDDPRVRWLALRVFGAALLCGALGAAVADAGGGGGGSSLLSSRQAFVTEARVAAGSGGAAVAVWNQQIGGGGSTLVVSSRRDARGGWSRPRALYGIADTTTFDPQVAIAPSGEAVIVWQSESITAPGSIEAVRRPSATGSWTTPAVIAYGTLFGSTALGIDDHGEAMLVYVGGSGRTERINVVGLNARNTSRRGPIVLGATRSQVPDPTVAVNAGGQAVAAWSVPRGRVRGNGSSYRFDSWVEAVVMRSERWSHPQRLGKETQFVYDLSTDYTSDGPQVAIDNRGRAIALWQHSPTRKRLIADAATLRDPATRWRALPAVSPGQARAPQVVSSPGGWVTLAWETRGLGIATRSGPITGCCWSHTTTFAGSPAASDFDLNLVAGPGHAAALDFAMNGNPMQLAIHPTTSTRWNKPLSVGHRANHKLTDPLPLSLAVSPTGQLLTVWTQESPSSTPGFLDAPLRVTAASER